MESILSVDGSSQESHRFSCGSVKNSAIGIGGAIGALVFSLWIIKYPTPQMNLTASFIEGLALFFIALTPNHWVAASLLVIIGGTTTAINVIAPSVNQSIIPKKLFGRVVSVMMLVMTGLVPITQALAGYVIDNTSSNQVFFYGGALELLTAGFAFFIPAVRNYSVQYFKRQGNLQ